MYSAAFFLFWFGNAQKIISFWFGNARKICDFWFGNEVILHKPAK